VTSAVLAGDALSNEAAADRVADVLARLHDQLTDMAAVREKQAAVEVSTQAAEGSVEVTVDARGQLVKTVIEKSFLDDHDFDELGDFITEAAQTAAREASERVAEMWAPISERQRSFPSFSDIVEGMPDLADLMPPGLEMFGAGAPRREGSSVSSVGGSYDDGDGGGEFPTVRR
jgi:DNA-binding protein YbaB